VQDQEQLTTYIEDTEEKLKAEGVFYRTDTSDPNEQKEEAKQRFIIRTRAQAGAQVAQQQIDKQIEIDENKARGIIKAGLRAGERALLRKKMAEMWTILPNVFGKPSLNRRDMLKSRMNVIRFDPAKGVMRFLDERHKAYQVYTEAGGSLSETDFINETVKRVKDPDHPQRYSFLRDQIQAKLNDDNIDWITVRSDLINAEMQYKVEENDESDDSDAAPQATGAAGTANVNVTGNGSGAIGQLTEAVTALTALVTSHYGNPGPDGTPWRGGAGRGGRGGRRGRGGAGRARGRGGRGRNSASNRQCWECEGWPWGHLASVCPSRAGDDDQKSQE
jgi:hypothetical protein